LVLKANLVSSGVTRFVEAARTLDAACSLLAHAADGIVLLRLSELPKGGVTKGLIGTLQTAAVAAQGSIVVLSGSGSDATHPSVWGTNVPGLSLMNAVKREFDPKNILNPDRFVYYS
jgi:FAD/FMN-containing dehydrogenase